jgi:hypothetical protein
MIAGMKRPCMACLVFDDHPRHEIIDPQTGADAHGGPMHMDCCAATRDCDVCKAVLERAYALAGEGAIGSDLRDALVQLPPLQVAHEQTAIGVMGRATVTEVQA